MGRDTVVAMERRWMLVAGQATEGGGFRGNLLRMRDGMNELAEWDGMDY